MAATTNLIASWSLDESSGNAADSSGNGNTLTNTGTVGYSAAKINNGANFDTSNKRLGVTNGLSMTNAGDYSWAFFIKLNSFAGYMFDHISTTGDRRVIVYGDTNKLTLYVDTNTVSTSTLSTGTFYWICVEKTGSSFELFLNNVSQGTVSFGGTHPSTTGYFSMGAAGDGFGANSNSQFDMFNVYNRVLGSQDRSILYNGGLGLQYPFNLSANFFFART